MKSIALAPLFIPAMIIGFALNSIVQGFISGWQLVEVLQESFTEKFK